MTREEATTQVKLLRNMADTMNDNRMKEALEMAIEALEFLDKYDAVWESIKYAGEHGREIELHRYGRVYRIREVAT